MELKIPKKYHDMWDYAAGLFGLKYILTVIGGVLVMLGGAVEPSAGIWIVAMGGTLLTASFGKDRSLHAIILYVCMGLGWGIFGSQLVVSLFPILPQRDLAFFIAMFGAEITWYVIKSLREGSIGGIVGVIVSNFKPFNFKIGSKE